MNDPTFAYIALGIAVIGFIAAVYLLIKEGRHGWRNHYGH